MGERLSEWVEEDGESRRYIGDRFGADNVAWVNTSGEWTVYADNGVSGYPIAEGAAGGRDAADAALRQHYPDLVWPVEAEAPPAASPVVVTAAVALLRAAVEAHIAAPSKATDGDLRRVADCYSALTWERG